MGCDAVPPLWEKLNLSKTYPSAVKTSSIWAKTPQSLKPLYPCKNTASGLDSPVDGLCTSTKMGRPWRPGMGWCLSIFMECERTELSAINKEGPSDWTTLPC